MSVLLRRSLFSRVVIPSFAFVLLLLLVSCGANGGSSSPVTLQGVGVTPANPSIAVGATQQFKATGNYSDGSSKDLTSSAKWTSKTTGVATVNSSGLATAVAAGSSVIQASSGGVSGSTTLTVNPPAVSFKSGQTFSSGGTRPISVVVADFNGDGKLDIAVSNEDTNTLAVFLNDGAGHFGSPVITNVQTSGAALGFIVAGDFNEDSKTDLAVSFIGGGNQVNVILLGNGDGTFQQQPAIANSAGFTAAKVVDLNGDGHQDLAMGFNGTLGVSLGVGDGTFNGTTYLPGGSGGAFLGLAVADFNGDGKLDMEALDVGNGTAGSAALNFYPGNGDGTFGPATISPIAFSSPTNIASGDFNGDGKLDLLIGFPNVAELALGNGDGTFDVTNAVIIGGDSTNSNLGVNVLAGDLDGDGNPDAVLVAEGNGTVQILLNSALQTNPPSGAISTVMTSGAGTFGVAVGDLDGDGIKDVVVVNLTTSQVTTILSK